MMNLSTHSSRPSFLTPCDCAQARETERMRDSFYVNRLLAQEIADTYLPQAPKTRDVGTQTEAIDAPRSFLAHLFGRMFAQ